MTLQEFSDRRAQFSSWLRSPVVDFRGGQYGWTYTDSCYRLRPSGSILRRCASKWLIRFALIPPLKPMLKKLRKAFKDCSPEAQFLVRTIYVTTDGSLVDHPAFSLQLVPTLEDVAAIGRNLSQFQIHSPSELRICVTPVLSQTPEVFAV